MTVSNCRDLRGVSKNSGRVSVGWRLLAMIVAATRSV